MVLLFAALFHYCAHESMDMKFDGVIVVLGSPNDAKGQLSSIALERCSQALAEFKENIMNRNRPVKNR